MFAMIRKFKEEIERMRGPGKGPSFNATVTAVLKNGCAAGMDKPWADIPPPSNDAAVALGAALSPGLAASAAVAAPRMAAGSGYAHLAAATCAAAAARAAVRQSGGAEAAAAAASRSAGLAAMPYPSAAAAADYATEWDASLAAARAEVGARRAATGQPMATLEAKEEEELEVLEQTIKKWLDKEGVEQKVALDEAQLAEEEEYYRQVEAQHREAWAKLEAHAERKREAAKAEALEREANAVDWPTIFPTEIDPSLSYGYTPSGGVSGGDDGGGGDLDVMATG